MLVKFTIGNFLSFKERVTLQLTASSISEYRNDNVSSTSIKDLNLLKGAVLYGANASGKSNLFKGMKFAKWFILNSSKNIQAGEDLDVEPFRLNTSNLEKPSFFEMEFMKGGFKYRYGFEVDNEKVHREWLYRQKKIKEYKMFERLYQDIHSDEKFDFDENLKQKTRSNALALSVSAQFNGEIAKELISKLNQIQFISGTRDQSHYERTIELLNEPEYKTRITNFISSANLGFREIKKEEIKITDEMLSGVPSELRKYLLNEHEVKVNTKHIVYDENNKPVNETYFNLRKDESLGTQKYFSLSGPIIEALIKGNTLIIDEFDARLHPILSKAIVNLFNSKSTNPQNAQLIFATHNVTLLSGNILRRDQIFLTKKDKFGSTQLNSLYEVKARKDASFEKDYMLGKYEAIPKIDFSNQLNLFQDM